MEATANIKFLRSTARKARLVAGAIRGKNVSAAMALLAFSVQNKVGEDFGKLLKSAVANLQNKNADANIDVDELRIKEVKVDNGPMLKRFRPRAQGRAYSILKRMCHISITVSN